MNNLDTTNLGRMPIVLDDLRFINNSIKEMLNGIVGHDNSVPIILSGCEVDLIAYGSGTLNMTAGCVYFNNEIFLINAIAGMSITSFLYFEAVETNDSAGFKTFGDGSTHDTYKLRVAEVNQGSSLPSGAHWFFNQKSIFQIYKEGMVTPADDSPATFSGDFLTEASNKFKAAVGVSGEVVLSGLITNSVGLSSSDDTIGTLKAEYRPTSTVYINAPILTSSLNYIQDCMIKIEPTGVMTFYSSLTASFITAKIVMNATYLK